MPFGAKRFRSKSEERSPPEKRQHPLSEATTSTPINVPVPVREPVRKAAGSPIPKALQALAACADRTDQSEDTLYEIQKDMSVDESFTYRQIWGQIRQYTIHYHFCQILHERRKQVLKNQMEKQRLNQDKL